MKEVVMNNGRSFVVDDEDFELINQHRWRPDKDGYPRTSFRNEGKFIDKRINRFIMEQHSHDIKGKIVDHKDGNILDNRKSNLRVTDKKGNAWNKTRKVETTSPYRGVRKVGDNKWIANVIINYEFIRIGTFTNEEACANAYNYHAKKFYGEYGFLNNIPFMSKEEWEKYLTPHSIKRRSEKLK